MLQVNLENTKDLEKSFSSLCIEIIVYLLIFVKNVTTRFSIVRRGCNRSRNIVLKIELNYDSVFR